MSENYFFQRDSNAGRSKRKTEQCPNFGARHLYRFDVALQMNVEAG
jgi:hypothetical protein